MRTWIFQANPNEFDIDGYLAAGPKEITWLVRRYSGEIQPGDVVYIWRSSGGEEGKAGIVARATALTEPANILDDPAAAPFWKRDAPTGTSTRVKLRVDGIANSREFIKRDWLVDDPACSEMLIIRQPAGTNFPLETREAERLRNLWIKTGVDWSRAESLAALQTYLALYGKQISRKPGSPVADLAMLIGRAVTGAYNKIMNFRAIDPRDSRDGMDGASNVDRSVWAEFFDERAQTIDKNAVSDEFQRLWPQYWLEPTRELQEERLEQAVEEAKADLDVLEARIRASRRPSKPRSGTTTTTVFNRDPNIIAYAKRRAGCRCEVPGCEVPLFLKPDGEPYVEVHHIHMLADGGEDTTDNVACLCPTHHREIHCGLRRSELEAALSELRGA
ncbi:EVE domain-containing protein [Cyanobium sp. N5-Cardenillas]|uniref:EVE domain-containing protein n=1 Tax=Cyanobium sp. N5-Cardenillas TaxID=2823720 RepID=UPI0020CCBE75|nr:EVE domain-containing protein [Cyanobium sp. N5-Cardenillas]MCP9787129.1 EVE domain-containing protein [Cyanobium sp. N5-Cardenillas]